MKKWILYPVEHTWHVHIFQMVDNTIMLYCYNFRLKVFFISLLVQLEQGMLLERWSDKTKHVLEYKVVRGLNHSTTNC